MLWLDMRAYTDLSSGGGGKILKVSELVSEVLSEVLSEVVDE